MMEQYAIHVWGISSGRKDTEQEIVREGIDRTEQFYRSIGLATRLSEIGIGDQDFEVMAQKAVLNGPIGNFKKLDKEDVLKIYRLAL